MAPEPELSLYMETAMTMRCPVLRRVDGNRFIYSSVFLHAESGRYFIATLLVDESLFAFLRRDIREEREIK